MESHVFGDLDLTGEIVERQLDRWNATRWARREEGVGPGEAFRYITIGRDEGTLGSEVAQELSKHLKWQVFDREIVSYIARTRRVRENLVRQLDEKSQGIFQDLISSLLEKPEYGSFGSVDYYETLVRTLVYLANQGSAIIVGRGASFALKEDRKGLHVRLTASPAVREQRLCESLKMTTDEARRQIRRSDEERRKFIHQYYRKNFEDMLFYDIVFNTDRASAEQVATSVIAFMNHQAMVY